MGPMEGPDQPYWAALSQGRLELPQCSNCDTWLWPAVDRCGSCGSDDITWKPHEMKGTIFAWTRTWHRFELTESLDLPFVSLVVELAGSGVRLLGRLEDNLAADPRIGDAVTGRIGTTCVLDREIPTILWGRC